MPEVLSYAQDQAGKVLWHYRHTKGRLNSVRQAYREKIYALSKKLEQLQADIDYLLTALQAEAESRVPAVTGKSVLSILSEDQPQVKEIADPYLTEIERRKLQVDQALDELVAYQGLDQQLADAEKVLDKNYEFNAAIFAPVVPMPTVPEVVAEIKQDDYIPKSEDQNLTVSMTTISKLPENMFEDDIEDAMTADLIAAEARNDEILSQVSAQVSDSEKNGVAKKPALMWLIAAVIAYYIMS